MSASSARSEQPGGGRPGETPPGAPGGRAPDQPWTVLGLILWSAQYLAQRGVEHGRLDAEHLLAHALGTTRLQLYLEFDRPLDAHELAAFKPLLLRRSKREPLQYVVGRAAFRDLELAVDRRVLIPRPETEVLVEAVLEWARAKVGGTRGAAPAAPADPAATAPGGPAAGLDALDVGTGSGCIALALLTEGPFWRVVATDASADALAVAAANAAAAGVADRWDARCGSLWTPLRADERFDVIVSNPPYVARSERPELQPEVRDWEPEGALFGGDEGLDVLVQLAAGAADRLRPGGLLALELGLGQVERVAQAIRSAGEFGEPRVRRDLAGRPRHLLAERG